MKLRIISDLHIDVNRRHLDLFKWDDKDVLTILAGDISGSLHGTSEFVRKHFKNAILVGGNHIVYNSRGWPIQRLHDAYRKEFPLDAPISFLEDDYKEIGDIVFIGATLWTDYEYGGAMKESIEYAERCMNDFHYGRFRRENGRVVKLNAVHCFNMFQKSLWLIHETYKKFVGSGKKMVLIVHHAPSPQAIDARYMCSELNAAYVSNLEDYIKTYLPNLSLIIHGHIHSRARYKIGNIPVVCNPCGYIDYGENLDEPAWDKDLIVEI
jgi:Icc-related predicted phosphoesterase